MSVHPGTETTLPATSPARCCLCVPGHSERKLAKARGIEVDELVLDLEDAVPPAKKNEARERVVRALAVGPWLADRLAVRINGLGTPWAVDDTLALARAPRPPHSIVVPKLEHPRELEAVETLLSAVSPGAQPILQALIETPRGVATVERIAASSPRLEAIVLGYEDLAASLGRRRSSAAPWCWAATQDRVLVAARAAGIAAIDGPCLELSSPDALARALDAVSRLGFDGKWAIHPAQVPTIAAAFTPTPEEVADARAMVSALDAADGGGVGAIAVGGRMADEASRRQALGVLARGRSERGDPE